MRDKLTKEEIDRLCEVGFTKADGSAVHTLGDLLETLPDAVEVFRYRPEQRWENMSEPTYWQWLDISKIDDKWSATYGAMTFSNPDLCLDYSNEELIVCLFKLAESYSTAPIEWIKK